MSNTRRSSSDSNRDAEVYRPNDVSSSSSPGTPLVRAPRDSDESDVVQVDEEEAIDIGRPKSSPTGHVRRRSISSIHSTDLEEPFTRGERLFMITSAVMVTSLTIAAVAVVLMKAKL